MSETDASSRRGTRAWRRSLAIFEPFLGLFAVYAFFALYDLAWDGDWVFDKFPLLFGSYNLKVVAAQTAIVAVAALGMTLIIISGGIDLSPGSSIALSTVVIAVWLKAGGSTAAALLLGVLCAGIVGLINGGLITGLRIVPFIVTLGMMGIARGFAKFLADAQRVTAPETALDGLLKVNSDPAAPWYDLPPGVGILLVLAIIVHLVLRYTAFGRYVFAIGSNEATARLCGVNVPLQKIVIYSVAGLLTGVAGLLQYSQLRVGDPTVAVGAELYVIASVVIGGGSLSGGRGSVLGTLIGAFVMGVLKNCCDLYGIPNYSQEIFIGIIIIAAVAVDQLRRH